MGKSNRIQIYLPVEPIQPPTINGQPVTDVLENKPALKQAEDCGGHGRALEIFYEQVNRQPAMSVSKLMNLIELSLRCKYESAFPDDFLAVQIRPGHETSRDDSSFTRAAKLYVATNEKFSQPPKILAATEKFSQKVSRHLVSCPGLVQIVKAVLGHKRLSQQALIPGTTITVDEVCSTRLIRFIAINSDYSSSGIGFIDAPYIWLWVLFKIPSCFIICSWTTIQEEENPTSPLEYVWSNLETFVELKSTMYNNGKEVAIGVMHYGARMSKLVNQTDTRATNDNMKQRVVKAPWRAIPSSEIDLCTCDYIARNAASAPYGDALLCLDRSGTVYCNEVHQWKLTVRGEHVITEISVGI
ncbi:hypothetical protein L211DRAFT_847839 [Terfezia boudieri ATCC MYA-4762]|uniref:Uncharacterized protein n=1 Tax=Terfezia boudieri ATCC MYA-4762 TaxID=1051890 RepID=A0A3N4LRC5_9PEZI|nr:hypothetical protein L211DRAFT_847839 [Terfezia boudieri ATCC MYA-4762]